MKTLLGKKALFFGMLGLIGCACGWGAGELFLRAMAAKAPSDDTDSSGLLVSHEIKPPPPPGYESLKDTGNGDIKLMLKWHNRDDLDLHCVDPSGFRIYYGKRLAPSGGNLDRDSNASDHPSEWQDDPAGEDIFWPDGKAPPGHYSVLVHYYARHQSSDPTTPFTVAGYFNGEWHQFAGAASTPKEFTPIFEFDVQKKFSVRTPEKEIVHAGATNLLRVAVDPDDATKPVELRFTGDVAKLSLPEKTIIEPGQKETTIKFTPDADATLGDRKVTARASCGDSVGWTDFTITVTPPASSFSWFGMLETGGWTGLIAVGLTLALVAGQNLMLGRPLLSMKQVLVLVPAALVAGLLAGAMGQVIAGMLTRYGSLGEVGRACGWTLLGALLGAGVSFFIPNLPRRHAAVAGAVGGLVGVAGFMAGTSVSVMVGRLLGAGLLGLAIGVVVAVAEALVRTACLEVRFGKGLSDIKIVNLGPEPVTIGNRSCTIPARGVTAPALRYRLVQQRVTCEDLTAGITHTVVDGDTRTLSNLTLVVRAAVAGPSQPAVAPPPASAAAPVRASTAAPAPPRGPAATAAPLVPARMLRLRVGERTTHLSAGSKLTATDVPGLSPAAADGIVAEVLAKPGSPNDLGLRNRSTSTWTILDGAISQKPVAPGAVAGLSPGKKIVFGRTSGDVLG